MKPFTSDDLVACYCRGVFPMAESRGEAGFHIVDPEYRCILPLERFHVSRRLARTMRQDCFRFTRDRAFATIIDACAAPREPDGDTWINADIRALYLQLHARGIAHSVETWLGERLVGGLYGVALGGVFFGESMYSRARDASKAALAHLVARLRFGGFKLLDVQFPTPHLVQFGALTLPRRSFRALLEVALATRGDFGAMADDASGAQMLAMLHPFSP